MWIHWIFLSWAMVFMKSTSSSDAVIVIHLSAFTNNSSLYLNPVRKRCPCMFFNVRNEMFLYKAWSQHFVWQKNWAYRPIRDQKIKSKPRRTGWVPCDRTVRGGDSAKRISKARALARSRVPAWARFLAPRSRIAPLSFAPTRTGPKNSKFNGPDPGPTRLYFPRTGPDRNNLASTRN